jgi:hypothetical protein
MWLTYIRVNETAGRLTHDLAIDASGFGQPDPVAAGYLPPAVDPSVERVLWVGALTFGVMLLIGAAARRRSLVRAV